MRTGCHNLAAKSQSGNQAGTKGLNPYLMVEWLAVFTMT
jgi:hypothetical protein